MSTSDRLPGPEGLREVKQSALITFSYWSSIIEASEAAQKWARENGYDAIIGVRFVPHPNGSYAYPISRQGTNADVKWACYGTAIAW